MATFGDIQEAVSGNLIDLPTFVADAVPGLINRAYRKAQSKHNFWIMRAEWDVVTVVGERSLGTVPSNWKEWRGDPYWTENSGAKHGLYKFPDLDTARGMWDTDEESEPEGLAEALPSDDGTVAMNVYPLPPGWSDYPDGEYRITVPYWKYLPALSADADTNWLTVEGEEWIEAQATYYGFAKDWDEDRQKEWEVNAAKAWKDLLLRDKYKHMSLMDTLIPKDGPYQIASINRRRGRPY